MDRLINNLRVRAEAKKRLDSYSIEIIMVILFLIITFIYLLSGIMSQKAYLVSGVSVIIIGSIAEFIYIHWINSDLNKKLK